MTPSRALRKSGQNAIRWRLRQGTDQPDVRCAMDALQSVASKWLTIDATAAAEWFNSLPDDAQKSQILSGAVRQVIFGDAWGEVDHEDALPHMFRLRYANIPDWIDALDDPKKERMLSNT